MTIKTRARRIKGTAPQHNQLGVTFYQSGAIDLAIEEFRRAAKRMPWMATYWLNLGAALIDKDEIDEAESVLKRGLALKPGSQSAYYHLAQVYAKRGDEPSVRDAYQKVIDLGPNTYLAQRARERLDDWHPRFR